MIDWVHCNTCFHQPARDGRKFYLTSCAHIFCSECVNEGSTNQCPMCQNPCTIIALSEKMKPDVEIFFQDPIDIVKKQFKQLTQVLEFQKSHRQRLTAHKREKDAKTLSMIETSRRQMEQAMDMEREVHRLQEENAALRRVLSGSLVPGGVTKNTLRPGMSGRILTNSSIPPNVRNMCHQSSSQPISRSSSPYTSNRPHQQSDASKTPQSQQPKTPITRTPPGPARFSIRTASQRQNRNSWNTEPFVGEHDVNSVRTLFRSANTPGGLVEMTTPGRQGNSPMNVSPASSRRGFSTHASILSSPYCDASSQGSATPGLSQTPHHNDPGRRQIQLNYTPKRPIVSAPPMSQHRQGKS